MPFDASSSPDAESHPPVPENQRAERPFLGIRFQCCRTYGRIYRNQQQTAYEGNCPKCRGRVTVPIGSGGCNSRFFNAS